MSKDTKSRRKNNKSVKKVDTRFDTQKLKTVVEQYKAGTPIPAIATMLQLDQRTIERYLSTVREALQLEKNEDIRQIGIDTELEQDFVERIKGKTYRSILKRNLDDEDLNSVVNLIAKLNKSSERTTAVQVNNYISAAPVVAESAQAVTTIDTNTDNRLPQILDH